MHFFLEMFGGYIETHYLCTRFSEIQQSLLNR